MPSGNISDDDDETLLALHANYVSDDKEENLTAISHCALRNRHVIQQQ